MESGGIEADGNTKAVLIVEDQLERGLRRGGLPISRNGERTWADMNGQEVGRVGLRLRRSGRVVAPSASWGRRRKSGSEAIKPLAKGREGNAAELTELDVGQTGLTKVGQDGGPIDLASRLSQGRTSEDRETGPILARPSAVLKMGSTGRLRSIASGYPTTS